MDYPSKRGALVWQADEMTAAILKIIFCAMTAILVALAIVIPVMCFRGAIIG